MCAATLCNSPPPPAAVLCNSVHHWLHSYVTLSITGRNVMQLPPPPAAVLCNSVHHWPQCYVTPPPCLAAMLCNPSPLHWQPHFIGSYFVYIKPLLPPVPPLLLSQQCYVTFTTGCSFISACTHTTKVEPTPEPSPPTTTCSPPPFHLPPSPSGHSGT